MKKLFMLPALFALVATGCGEDSPAVDPGWAQEAKTKMNEYLGMVLPYVQFNQESFYCDWDEEQSTLYIGDDNDTNVLVGYGDRLISTGWTAVASKADIEYTKSTEAGELTLHYGYYEATEEYNAGNEIAVYVDSEGGGPGDEPVTGTFEFAMSDYGWADAEVISATSLAPGLTIDASKNGGSNDPKYYASGASIRLYPNNSITFSADNMTKIEFTFTRIDDNFAFNPDSGTFSADYAAKTGVWTGDASSVTFTLGSGSGKQIRISAVKVTGTFSGGSSPVDPGDERTVESIANDIINALFTDPDPSSDIEWDGSDAYVSVVFETTSLEDACLAGIDYLPDYLAEEEAPHSGEWDDGDAGYFATYVDEEYIIYVEIGTYAYDEANTVVQFCIYQMVY